MIVQFECENFLSFKEASVFSMVPVESYAEHAKSHMIYPKKRGDIKLLKSAAIFGSNGGGKSNFMIAISFMKAVISRSFKDSLEPESNRPSWNYFHRLSTETTNKPTTFEMTFLVDQEIYRYGFSIKDWNIIGEWLFKTDRRETMLFERFGMDFNFNKSSFPEGKEYKSVNPNVLLLSYLAQHNRPKSSILFEWFSGLNVIDGLENDHVKAYTKNLLERDSNFREWASVALEFLEISGIEVEGDELVAIHNRFDQDNYVAEQVKFYVDREESNGTKKLIYLLGGLYDTLSRGAVFAIDEFDSKLHPNLTRKLVELFHEHNVNDAQFIITVHDPTLLDKDIYRRDQIWFIDKNQFGASEIYPMSNFKASSGLRSTSDFRKMYLNCHFGAAESIELSERLISLLSNG